jgi:hypothetical protein
MTGRISYRKAGNWDEYGLSDVNWLEGEIASIHFNSFSAFQAYFDFD